MADILFKKRRVEEKLECCICGVTGTSGFTNTFQVSLRDEMDYSINFNELIFFTVGINVQKESSDICQVCKPKMIEYFHFKKKSQSVHRTFSPLLQEIMKIVGNYVSNKNIKAVTIEESSEQLIIKEKNATNLKITEVSSICDLQIKKEIDSNELDSTNLPDIEIKKEPPDSLEDYNSQLQSNSDPFLPDEIFDNPGTSEDKLNIILGLNKEILDIVTEIKHFQQMKNSTINNPQ